MESLSHAERLKLQDMIDKSGASDFTENIRKLRHSKPIKTDVLAVERVKAMNPNMSIDELRVKASADAVFLYTHYTDIFNKLIKRDIDIDLLFQLLMILERIENGEFSQHEASVHVGTILKEIYVDSGRRAGQRLDSATSANSDDTEAPNTGRADRMSWAEFQRKRM